MSLGYIQPTRAEQKDRNISLKRWNSIHTPIYDELISKLEVIPTGQSYPTYSCSEKNQDLFHSYTKKLENYKGPTGIYQLCGHWTGMNSAHLYAFQNSEKEQYLGISFNNLRSGIESIKKRKNYVAPEEPPPPSVPRGPPPPAPSSPYFIKSHRTGFVPHSDPQRFIKEAIEIWDSIPSPLYDEMCSKFIINYTDKSGYHPTEYICNTKSKSIFWSYVEKLGADDFEKKIGKKHEKICNLGKGGAEIFSIDYLLAFQSIERERIYGQGYTGYQDIMKALAANNNSKTYKKERNMKYTNREWANLPSGSTMFEQNMANIKEHRRQQSRKATNKKRYAQVKTGNLLGLKNKRNGPNLLSFEPTEEGMKSRGNELEGLFGGKRRTRKRKV